MIYKTNWSPGIHYIRANVVNLCSRDQEIWTTKASMNNVNWLAVLCIWAYTCITGPWFQSSNLAFPTTWLGTTNYLHSLGTFHFPWYRLSLATWVDMVSWVRLISHVNSKPCGWRRFQNKFIAANWLHPFGGTLTISSWQPTGFMFLWGYIHHACQPKGFKSCLASMHSMPHMFVPPSKLRFFQPAMWLEHV